MFDYEHEKDLINKEILALQKMQKIAKENMIIGTCIYCVTTDDVLSKVISSIFLFQMKMLEDFFMLMNNKAYYLANLVAGVLFENYISLYWIYLDKREERARYYIDYSLIYNIREEGVSSDTLNVLSKFLKKQENNPYLLESYYDSWRIEKVNERFKTVSIKSICDKIGERYKIAGGTDISKQLQGLYHIYCSYKHCEPQFVLSHNLGERDNIVQKQTALQLTYFSVLETLKFTYFHLTGKKLDCSELLVW